MNRHLCVIIDLDTHAPRAFIIEGEATPKAAIDALSEYFDTDDSDIDEYDVACCTPLPAGVDIPLTDASGYPIVPVTIPHQEPAPSAAAQPGAGGPR